MFDLKITSKDKIMSKLEAKIIAFFGIKKRRIFANKSFRQILETQDFKRSD